MPRLSLPLALLLSLAPAHAAGPPPAPLRPLTAADRDRLDRAALCLPADGLAEASVDLAGAVPAWLLDRAELPAEYELCRAAYEHNRICTGRVVPTPPAARRILDRLAACLPDHLRPAGFHFALTVLDRQRPEAFTPGGGLVYLTRGLLEPLQASGARGEAALAWLLGRELAHTGLLHTRRGWRLVRVEEDVQGGLDRQLDRPDLRRSARAGVRLSGSAVRFLYSREQEHSADVLALHLCTAAGFDADAALDGARLLAAARHPGARRGGPPDSTREPADPLPRLRRLLLERDGKVEGNAFGLFLYDRATGQLRHCADGSVAAAQRPVIFVHGLRGSRNSFRAYLRYLAERLELRGRALLVLRHPNNASLARCGRFLHREVERVVAAEARPAFVCHSAGGLVFRYYAEVLGGWFDRAVLLATPHRGSNLTGLKFLVDLAEFTIDLTGGLAYAIAGSLPEGRGEIALDLHPDSLFLRSLKPTPPLLARYTVFYGQYLTPLRALALQAAFVRGRELADEHVLAGLPRGLRQGARGRLDRLRLPREMLSGDLIVSTASAALPGAGRLVRVPLHHQAFRSDPDLIRQVLAVLVGP
jgi:hypothetical protein